MILVVMGVTGSGKTTIAKELASKLGWKFLDADDFHSAANREKMSKGIHLTDEDRIPWLDAMHAALAKLNDEGQGAVLACSALREWYLQRLDAGLPVRVVYLKGSKEVIAERIRERHGHFAGVAILDDQFATLEEPKDAITVSVEKSPDEIVDEVIGQLLREKG